MLPVAKKKCNSAIQTVFRIVSRVLKGGAPDKQDQYVSCRNRTCVWMRFCGDDPSQNKYVRRGTESIIEYRVIIGTFHSWEVWRSRHSLVNTYTEQKMHPLHPHILMTGCCVHSTPQTIEADEKLIFLASILFSLTADAWRYLHIFILGGSIHK